MTWQIKPHKHYEVLKGLSVHGRHSIFNILIEEQQKKWHTGLNVMWRFVTYLSVNITGHPVVLLICKLCFDLPKTSHKLRILWKIKSPSLWHKHLFVDSFQAKSSNNWCKTNISLAMVTYKQKYRHNIKFKMLSLVIFLELTRPKVFMLSN